MVQLTPARAEALVEMLCTTMIETTAEEDDDDAAPYVRPPQRVPLSRQGGSRRRTTAVSPARPLYGWLTAEAISLTGTRVSMIALPWFVLTTTGARRRPAWSPLAEMLPLVLLKVLGRAGDRPGRRPPGRDHLRPAVGAVASARSRCCTSSGCSPFPVFLLLVALAGALRGPGDAAKAAMTPTVVAEAGVPMERATGLHATVERTAGLVGAAVAGGAGRLVGAADALVVDAAQLRARRVVLAWSPPGSVPAAPREPDADAEPRRRTPSELREGWTFLRGDRVLLGIAVMVALTNLLDLAYVAVLRAGLGGGDAPGAPRPWAWCSRRSAARAAIGSVCAAAWADRLPRYRTYLIAFLICGAPRYVVFALDVPLWSVLAVCVAGGFASGFLNPILGAVIFERIPAPLMGRVTSLNTAMCYSLIPFGGLLGGARVAGVGLSPALLVTGAAYLVTTMAPTRCRVRRMDRPRAGARGPVNRRHIAPA